MTESSIIAYTLTDTHAGTDQSHATAWVGNGNCNLYVLIWSGWHMSCQHAIGGTARQVMWLHGLTHIHTLLQQTVNVYTIGAPVAAWLPNWMPTIQ